MLFQRRSQKAEVLKTVPLFQNLSKKDLDGIARIADEVESNPGEVLMRQGEPGREFILIAGGKVRVEQDGKIIAHLGPGEFLGEMALLDGLPRSATAVTEEPSSLLVIHWGRFWPLLETTPGVQRKMLISLSARLRERENSVSN